MDHTVYVQITVVNCYIMYMKTKISIYIICWDGYFIICYIMNGPGLVPQQISPCTLVACTVSTPGILHFILQMWENKLPVFCTHSLDFLGLLPLLFVSLHVLTGLPWLDGVGSTFLSVIQQWVTTALQGCFWLREHNYNFKLILY